MFCTFTLVLPVVCVQCSIRLFFWQFLNFVLSRYVTQVLSEWFWNVSSHPRYYWQHFCLHIPPRWISVMRSLYFKIFSASFLIKFLSPGTATSISMHIPWLFSWIMMYGLLLGIVLSDSTCCFHNMVTLPSWLASTDFGTWSCRCLLSNFTPFFLAYIKVQLSNTLSCLLMYCYFANAGQSVMMGCTVSSKSVQGLHLLFLFVIFLSYVIWFAMPHIVLLLFHFQSVLSALPSAAIGTCLLR